ncbi:MAG: hypothetical protein COA96_15630 [SAR86 cluster bacterium]|uniref:Uncharacterized protein n=1 Tax=SAR86 cluster bacterium TaxID=2030880 RepID=A0A2A5ANK4_9GAMM|nr:MAG: hypothetical protein COA96_15630 [SAR86 cluster bacterium]
MKLEITELGVFAPSGKKNTPEIEVPVGTVIEINVNKIPASLIGKCRIVGEVTKESVPVTNPAEKKAEKPAEKKAD